MDTDFHDWVDWDDDPDGFGALSVAEQSATTITTVVERNLLQHVHWLPGQMQVFMDPSKARLFRAGNQSQGKTWAGCAEAIWEARGRHPFRRPTRPHQPAEVWIICVSWSQSIAIQKKLWGLLPTDWVHPDTEFTEENGFRTKDPLVKVRHVSGGWSVIRIKTTAQGGLRLAGATIDFAVFDEPPHNSRVYTEVRKRLQASNGRLLMTLTPVNRDCSYLVEEVKEGRLKDFHFPLRAENMVPVGLNRPIRLKDGTPCDQAWIDSVRKNTMAVEEPVVVDGEWEFRAVGRVFEAFDRTIHVHDRLPKGDVTLVLGSDLGTDVVKVKNPDGRTVKQLGRQCSVLVAVWTVAGDPHPYVMVLDSWRAPRVTTTDDDAAAILEMLRKVGQPWAALTSARTDRVHMKGTAKQKSAKDLQAALARQLGLRDSASLRPPVRTAKRGSGRGHGSVMTGVRWLHQQMVRTGHFIVHPRAEHVIEALEKWDLSADSIWKDILDALRYALDPYIFRHQSTGRPQTIGVT